MTDTSVKERLLDKAEDAYAGAVRANLGGAMLNPHESSLNAILAELAEPSEGMWRAGFYAPPGEDGPIISQWRAMIQHIRDGGA